MSVPVPTISLNDGNEVNLLSSPHPQNAITVYCAVDPHPRFRNWFEIQGRGILQSPSLEKKL
jgi:hypothetical protein